MKPFLLKPPSYSTAPEAYDTFYNNAHCVRENRNISIILNKYIREGDSGLDIGSGSGLARRLIRRRIEYVPLDISDWGMDGQIVGDAYHVVKTLPPFDVITALFSLNYIDTRILNRLVQMSRVIIAVVYNKPYKKGSHSYYAGKRGYFTVLHGLGQLSIKAWTARNRHLIELEKPICNEEFYTAYVIRGRLWS